mgnify:CR=1 FL=1
MARPNRNEYYLELASTVAQRSTCDRRHVGAIIVRNDVIIATGFNGAPRGLGHCDDVGHEMIGGHCVRTVNAEMNAIIHAAREGHSTIAGTLYCTDSPCYDCAKALINAGIEKIVYKYFYQSRYEASKQTLEFLRATGITVEGPE